MINEYKNRHDQIWPKLQKLLKNVGISEYSIFFDEETNSLFGYQKISGADGSQSLGSEDIVKRWWNYMADIMETKEDNSPVSTLLNEIFYLA